MQSENRETEERKKRRVVFSSFRVRTNARRYVNYIAIFASRRAANACWEPPETSFGTFVPKVHISASPCAIVLFLQQYVI